MESANSTLGVYPASKVSRSPRLTASARTAWLQILSPGDVAIDATAGHGNDTHFLAALVGSSGHVFAFDIQAQALRSANRHPEKANSSSISWVWHAHQDMRGLLPQSLRPRLIVFNLGYLPHYPNGPTTSATTTLSALSQATTLLQHGGALSVICYRGHHGGIDEADAVAQFLHQLPPQWRTLQHITTGSANRPGPVWHLLASFLPD
jgi:hypothetical protein